MAAGNDGKAGAGAPPPAAGGGGSKLPLIFTLLNLIATLGMLAILAMSFQKDKVPPKVEDINAHAEGGEEKHAEKKEGGHGGGEGGHGEGKEHKKKSMDYGKTVTLDQFTVNLSTPGSVTPRFVRVNISLEVPNDDTEEEVNKKMPRIRNSIIDLFNSKRPSDLATADGREYLKEEIKNALNSFMISGKVKGVFFTNFALSS